MVPEIPPPHTPPPPGRQSRGNELTPREIVRELDRYIIGQDNAKKSVAIASRSRTDPSVITPAQPSPLWMLLCTSPQNAPNP